MSDLDITGRVVFDASQAEGALDKIGDKADQMAREVQGAAVNAGKAVDKIGAGAAGSAEKFTKAEGLFAASIKRTQTSLELLGKTASEKLEFKLNAQGLDAAKFEPMLAKLRETEKAAFQSGNAASASLGRIGISAGQTKAALQQLPAQFTDIVTSLQGGQKPLTVLIQQGGQIKDSFGGAGNAIRALGGYVAGLINPFTLALGAAGALGFAAFKGSEELSAYNRALILSGNSAGVTSGQLQAMAQRISGISGTTGAAAESLTAFAKAGVVGASSLESISGAASRFSTVTGTALKDIVGQFAELKKAPLEASVKLNESTNFLTESLYKQIKALEDQGRATEAATLAQQAFAQNLDSQQAALVAKLGIIEKSWLAIKSAVKGAGDAILDIGRDPGLDQQIAAQKAIIAKLDRPTGSGRLGNTGSQDLILNGAKEALAILQESARIEARRVANSAEQLSIVQARAVFDKDGLQLLSNTEKREREIAKVRQEGLAARASEEEISKRIAAINDKYKDKPAGQTKAQISEQQTSLASYVNTLEKQLQKEEKLNEVEKARLFLQGLGTTGQIKQVESLVLSQAALVDAKKAQDEYVKSQLKGIEAAEKSAKSAGDTLQKYLDEEQALTLAAAKNISLAQAIAEVELARLREAQTTAIASNANQGVLLALDEEIKKREQIVQAIGRKESREAVDKSAKEAAADWKKAAEQIEQSITDALFRGFESGKGFGENLRDTLENTFKTLVLRPIIQGTVRGVLGGSQGVDGLDPSNPFSGIASIAKSFESIGPALTDFKLFATNGAYDLGGSLTNAGFDKAGSLVTKNASQIGSLANTVGRTLGYLEAASNFKDGSYGKSIGQAAGTAFFGPIGGQIGKELGSVVDRLFSKGEYVQSTGDANAVFNSTGQAVSRNNFAGANSNAISNKAADDFINGLQKSYADAAKRLGIGAVTSSFVFGSNNSDGGKFALGGGAGSSNFRQEEIKATPEAIQLASSRAIFAALQGSELPGYLSKVFDGITASTAAQADIDAALAYAGSLKQIRDALTETRTPLQILQDSVSSAFTALGTSADTFKTDFVKAIDAGISPDSLAQYLALGQNLDALAQASGTATTAVTEVARSLGDIANERKNLQAELDRLTLSGSELLAKQRDALDESNRALFDQVQAAQSAKDAQQALSDAQEKAAQDAIDLASSIASQRSGLQDQLDSLTLTNEQLLQKQRDALYESNRALFDQVQAAQAAKTAAQELADAQTKSAQQAAAAVEAMAQRVSSAISGLSNTRFTLENQLLTLQGNTGEVATRTRSNDLSKLTDGITSQSEIDRITASYDYNLSLTAQIDALTASKAAAEENARAQAQAQDAANRAAESAANAANKLRDAWQSVTDSIFDEVRRIRGLTGAGSAQSFAQAQSNFSIAAAQAKAGDQDAAKLLPELSKVLLSLAETQATSLLQLRVIQGQTAGALEAVGGSLASQYGLTLPKLATGTNYIPKDGPYYLHEGESVVPVAYNPSSGGQNNDALIAEMQAMRGMLAALQAAADKTATATTNSDKTLTRVTRGGDNMITKDYTVQ